VSKTIAVDALLGDLDQAAGRADLQHHRDLVESEHPQAARFGPFERQDDQDRKPPSTGWVSRFMPEAEKFYKENGNLK